jgi:hypothetical protein
LLDPKESAEQPEKVETVALALDQALQTAMQEPMVKQGKTELFPT